MQRLLVGCQEIGKYTRQHPTTVSRKIRRGDLPAMPRMRKGGGWVWVTSVTLIDWAIMESYEGRMKERRSQVLAQLSDAELTARVARNKREGGK